MGTDKSKGTKLFCVSGDVDRPGVYEMEMGCSLRELVEDLAGARDIGWVQVGGSTGGIIPNSELDTKLASLCGLGQTAAVPVLDTLKHFKKDYENRISQAELLLNLQPI